MLIVPCWLLAIQMYEKSGSPGSPHLGPRSGGNTTPVLLVPGSVPAVVPTSLSVPEALTAPVVSTAVVAVTSPVDEDEDEDDSEIDLEDDPGQDTPKGGAEVVSLDKWRK